MKDSATLDRTKHDHRKSLWVIAGGAVLWCYRCGAWRANLDRRYKRIWHKPTGPKGINPAMKPGYPV